MRPLHPIKVATTFAVFVACMHAGWALLVAVGWAQSFINFTLWLHFLAPIHVVQPFSWSIAAGLIAFSFVASFFVALLFVYVWNRLHVE